MAEALLPCDSDCSGAERVQCDIGGRITGYNVNVNDKDGTTPLDMADDKETANLLRKHGGKTGEELKAEGK